MSIFSESFQNKSKLISRRMFILSSIKVIVFISIISRLFYLQISENIKYRSLSDKNRLREWKIAPQRGIIKDYFGKKIAENTQVFQGENHSNKIKTTRKQRRIQARAEKKRKKKELRNKRKREKATKLVEKEDESDDEMTMLNFILKLSELDEVNVFVM